MASPFDKVRSGLQSGSIPVNVDMRQETEKIAADRQRTEKTGSWIRDTIQQQRAAADRKARQDAILAERQRRDQEAADLGARNDRTKQQAMLSGEDTWQDSTGETRIKPAFVVPQDPEKVRADAEKIAAEQDRERQQLIANQRAAKSRELDYNAEAAKRMAKEPDAILKQVGKDLGVDPEDPQSIESLADTDKAYVQATKQARDVAAQAAQAADDKAFSFKGGADKADSAVVAEANRVRQDREIQELAAKRAELSAKAEAAKAQVDQTTAEHQARILAAEEEFETAVSGPMTSDQYREAKVKRDAIKVESRNAIDLATNRFARTYGAIRDEDAIQQALLERKLPKDVPAKQPAATPFSNAPQEAPTPGEPAPGAAPAEVQTPGLEPLNASPAVPVEEDQSDEGVIASRIQERRASQLAEFQATQRDVIAKLANDQMLPEEANDAVAAAMSAIDTQLDDATQERLSPLVAEAFAAAEKDAKTPEEAAAKLMASGKLSKIAPALGYDDAAALYLANVDTATFKPKPEPVEGKGWFAQLKRAPIVGDVVRGAEVSTRQLPQLGFGVAALIGDTLEKTVGKGETLRNWGFRGYLDAEQGMAPISREDDDVTVAWSKASKGNLGAMANFLEYAVGYGIGQILETIAVSAAGGAIGGAAGTAVEPGGGTAVGAVGGALGGAFAKGAVKTGIRKFMAEAIASQAEKMALKQLGKTAAKAEVKALAQTATLKQAAAKAIGSNTAILTNALGMELGAIYGEAAKKAKEEGRELTGWELARVWGTGIAAGGLESVADKFGLDLLGGKKMPKGVTGRAVRAATGAAQGVAMEGGTEALQTVLERVGAGQNPIDAEGRRDIINATAMGGIMGGGVGAIGGALSSEPVNTATPQGKIQVAWQNAATVTTPEALAAHAGIEPAQYEALVKDFGDPSQAAAKDFATANLLTTGAQQQNRHSDVLAPVTEAIQQGTARAQERAKAMADIAVATDPKEFDRALLSARDSGDENAIAEVVASQQSALFVRGIAKVLAGNTPSTAEQAAIEAQFEGTSAPAITEGPGKTPIVSDLAIERAETLMPGMGAALKSINPMGEVEATQQAQAREDAKAAKQSGGGMAPQGTQQPEVAAPSGEGAAQGFTYTATMPDGQTVSLPSEQRLGRAARVVLFQDAGVTIPTNTPITETAGTSAQVPASSNKGGAQSPAEIEAVAMLQSGSTPAEVRAKLPGLTLARIKALANPSQRTTQSERGKASFDKGSYRVPAEVAAWDQQHRTERHDEWFDGANVNESARRGFDEARANGGHDIQAHGMAKAGTLSGGLADLLNMITNGLDPSRIKPYSNGELMLETAPLVSEKGGSSAGATPNGSAYSDGPFQLLARPGQYLEGQYLEGLGAILINEAHADQAATIKAEIAKVRPDLIVGTYSEAGAVVAQLNAKAKGGTKGARRGQKPEANGTSAGQDETPTDYVKRIAPKAAALVDVFPGGVRDAKESELGESPMGYARGKLVVNRRALERYSPEQAETLVRHELIHHAMKDAVREGAFSDADVAGVWSALGDSREGKKLQRLVRNAYFSSRSMKAEAAEASDFVLGAEMIRMMVEDAEFAGQISEAVIGNAEATSMVRRILRELRKWLKLAIKQLGDANPELKAELEAMAAATAQALRNLKTEAATGSKPATKPKDDGQNETLNASGAVPSSLVDYIRDSDDPLSDIDQLLTALGIIGDSSYYGYGKGVDVFDEIVREWEAEGDPRNESAVRARMARGNFDQWAQFLKGASEVDVSKLLVDAGHSDLVEDEDATPSEQSFTAPQADPVTPSENELLMASAAVPSSMVRRFGVTQESDPFAFAYLGRRRGKINTQEIKTKADLDAFAEAEFARRSANRFQVESESIRRLEPVIRKAAEKQAKYGIEEGFDTLATLSAGESSNYVEAAARKAAADNGREWREMNAYERQSYLDEAENAMPKRSTDAGWSAWVEQNVNRPRREAAETWKNLLVAGPDSYASDPYAANLAWDILENSIGSRDNYGLGRPREITLRVLESTLELIRSGEAGDPLFLYDEERAKAATKGLRTIKAGEGHRWVFVPGGAAGGGSPQSAVMVTFEDGSTIKAATRVDAENAAKDAIEGYLDFSDIEIVEASSLLEIINDYPLSEYDEDYIGFAVESSADPDMTEVVKVFETRVDAEDYVAEYKGQWVHRPNMYDRFRIDDTFPSKQEAKNDARSSAIEAELGTLTIEEITDVPPDHIKSLMALSPDSWCTNGEGQARHYLATHDYWLLLGPASGKTLGGIRLFTGTNTMQGINGVNNAEDARQLIGDHAKRIALLVRAEGINVTDAATRKAIEGVSPATTNEILKASGAVPVTPKMDAEYLAAVGGGNTTKARKVFESAAKAAGVKLYSLNDAKKEVSQKDLDAAKADMARFEGAFAKALANPDDAETMDGESFAEMWDADVRGDDPEWIDLSSDEKERVIRRHYEGGGWEEDTILELERAVEEAQEAVDNKAEALVQRKNKYPVADAVQALLAGFPVDFSYRGSSQGSVYFTGYAPNDDDKTITVRASGHQQKQGGGFQRSDMDEGRAGNSDIDIFTNADGDVAARILPQSGDWDSSTIRADFATVIKTIEDRLGIKHDQSSGWVALQKENHAVTYDETGRVIPLSERFNPESDSILRASGATPEEPNRYQRERQRRIDATVRDTLGLITNTPVPTPPKERTRKAVGGKIAAKIAEVRRKMESPSKEPPRTVALADIPDMGAMIGVVHRDAIPTWQGIYGDALAMIGEPGDQEVVPMFVGRVPEGRTGATVMVRDVDGEAMAPVQIPVRSRAWALAMPEMTQASQIVVTSGGADGIRQGTIDLAGMFGGTIDATDLKATGDFIGVVRGPDGDRVYKDANDEEPVILKASGAVPVNYARHAVLESKFNNGTITEAETTEAEALVASAARNAGFDSPRVFHGRSASFNKFDKRFGGKNTEARSAKIAFFFTTDERTARAYAVYSAEDGPIKEAMREAEKAERRGDWDGYDEAVRKAEALDTAASRLELRKNADVFAGYLSGRFMEFDAEGKSPQELTEDGDIDEGLTGLLKDARRQGYDGVIFRNLDDAIGLFNVPADHYAVFNSNQIKSAEPFTGTRLSERFNPQSNDIRYSAAPAPVLRGNVEAVREALKNRFGGSIPSGVRVVDLPNETWLGMIQGNEILVNAATNQARQAPLTVAHEIGHYVWRKPGARKAFDRFTELLTPAERARVDEIIRDFYDGPMGEYASEERAVLAFENMIAKSGPDTRTAWERLVNLVTRAVKKLFGVALTPAEAKAQAWDIFASGLRGFRGGPMNGDARYSSKAGGMSKDAARHAELEAKFNAGTITEAETREAQRITRKAARDAGFTEKGWHGGAKGIEEFSTPTFFATEKRFAEAFAKQFHGADGQVYETFIAAKNPLRLDRLGVKSTQTAFMRFLQRNGIVLDFDPITVWDSVRSILTGEEKADTYEATQSLVDDDDFVAALRNAGFDSITQIEPGESLATGNTKSLIVIDPSQIKLADPFTGVPLDKRFNPASDDIRYSYAGASAQMPQFMADALQSAKAMAAAGKSSEEIRAVTGWFPGPYDGKMRFEIPDDGAETRAMTQSELRQGELTRALGDFLDHPAFFDAYPEARDITVKWRPQPLGGGVFRPSLNEIELNNPVSYRLLSDLLHELQHWIQDREGFAVGTSLDGMDYAADQVAAQNRAKMDAIKISLLALNRQITETSDPQARSGLESRYQDGVDELNALRQASAEARARADQATPAQRMGAYRRNAGEIEARDVQARQSMTPEQRKAVAPYSSENIAPEDAIVMFGASGPQMSAGESSDILKASGAVPSFRAEREAGFFSQLEQVIGSKITGRFASPEQVKALIQNPGSGVKADEIKWSGVIPAIDRIAKENGGKVPREALLAHLRDSGRVRFEEVAMGGRDRMTAPQSAERLRRALREDGFNATESDSVVQAASRYENTYLGRNARIADLVQETISDYRGLQESGENATKFAQYQIPGGSNYREVVLAMGGKPDAERYAKMESIRKELENPNLTEDQKRALRVQYRDLSDVSTGYEGYTSSHFPDVANYVAHMRTNEREGGLFIEEIQSDRGQAIRKDAAGMMAQLDDAWVSVVTRMKKDGILKVVCP
jgi:hypothetical protein